jgi:hypothetical protein
MPDGKTKKCKAKLDGRCCSYNACLYCVECSNVNAIPPQFFCLCNPFKNNDRRCWYIHLADIARAEELAAVNDTSSGSDDESDWENAEFDEVL